jgi:hypothetical protein
MQEQELPLKKSKNCPNYRGHFSIFAKTAGGAMAIEQRGDSCRWCVQQRMRPRLLPLEISGFPMKGSLGLVLHPEVLS